MHWLDGVVHADVAEQQRRTLFDKLGVRIKIVRGVRVHITIINRSVQPVCKKLLSYGLPLPTSAPLPSPVLKPPTGLGLIPNASSQVSLAGLGGRQLTSIKQTWQ